MKKYLTLLIALVLTVCIFAGASVSVFAEETTTEITEEIPESNLPTTNEVINGMTDNELFTDEDKQLIKDLTAKVEGYTSQSDSFFIKYIVPIIVASVLVLLFGILLLLPIFKAKGETKTVKAMLTNAKEKLAEKENEIKTLKASLDSETIKNDIKSFMGKEIKIFSTMIQDSLTKENVELNKIEASLLALINGAINAWQASPEAVAKLTQSANAEELKNLAAENAKLTTFIYDKYGEEAKKELESL